MCDACSRGRGARGASDKCPRVNPTRSGPAYSYFCVVMYLATISVHCMAPTFCKAIPRINSPAIRISERDIFEHHGIVNVSFLLAQVASLPSNHQCAPKRRDGSQDLAETLPREHQAED